MKNIHVELVKQAIREPFTHPGLYPKHFVTHAGVLCCECVQANFREVIRDTRACRGAWNIQITVLWEGEHNCIECGTSVDAAYGVVRD